MYVIPHFRGYAVRQEVAILENGAQTHVLVKVPIGEVVQWDASHDALGRRTNGDNWSDTQENQSVVVGDKA